MEYRNDEESNEGRDFRGNSGCFNPGDERVCDKRGPGPDGNFEQREREDGDGQFRDGRDDREGRFEDANESDGFERREFDDHRDDSNRDNDEEERHRHRRDD
uniref:Uncharacterized protein n=1 Tax=Panagrolaimus superbus TaxID=310955 RepID=A0A914Z5V4_9BILA